MCQIRKVMIPWHNTRYFPKIVIILCCFERLFQNLDMVFAHVLVPAVCLRKTLNDIIDFLIDIFYISCKNCGFANIK